MTRWQVIRVLFIVAYRVFVKRDYIGLLRDLLPKEEPPTSDAQPVKNHPSAMGFSPELRKMVRGGGPALLVVLLLSGVALATGQIGVMGYPPTPVYLKGGDGIAITPAGTISATGVPAGGVTDNTFKAYTSAGGGRATNDRVDAQDAAFANHTSSLGSAAYANIGTTAGTVAAGDDARLGLAGTALQPGDVVNDLTTGGVFVPLSAEQGKALAAEIQEKISMGGAYSLDDPEFGVVGDGITDDTAAIQAALDDPRQVLIVPYNRYLIRSPGLIASKRKIIMSINGFRQGFYGDAPYPQSSTFYTDQDIDILRVKWGKGSGGAVLGLHFTATQTLGPSAYIGTGLVIDSDASETNAEASGQVADGTLAHNFFQHLKVPFNLKHLQGWHIFDNTTDVSTEPARMEGVLHSAIYGNRFFDAYNTANLVITSHIDTAANVIPSSKNNIFGNMFDRNQTGAGLYADSLVYSNVHSNTFVRNVIGVKLLGAGVHHNEWGANIYTGNKDEYLLLDGVANTTIRGGTFVPDDTPTGWVLTENNVPYIRTTGTSSNIQIVHPIIKGGVKTTGIEFSAATTGSKVFDIDAQSLTTSVNDINGGNALLNSGAGGAPVDATYITKTPNGTLSGEQPLSALATGLLKNTTGTGDLSIATKGSDYYGPSDSVSLLDIASSANGAPPTGVTATAIAGGSLAASTTYYYKIGAVFGNAEYLSGEVSATTTDTNKSIKVDWTNPSNYNNLVMYRTTVSGNYSNALKFATTPGFITGTDSGSGFFTAAGTQPPNSDNTGIVVKNGKIGIGTADPVLGFEMVGTIGGGTPSQARIRTITDTASGGGGLFLYHNRPSSLPLSGDRLGYLLFGGLNGTAQINSALIAGYAEENFVAGTNQGASLQFATTGPTTATRTERMRITGAGNVGIGTTTPEAQLDINSATGANLQLTYNDSNGSAANKVNFATSSTGDLTITPSGGDANVVGTTKSTQFADTPYAPAAGTTFTVDLANGMDQELTTSGNVTITLPTPVAGKSYSVRVKYGGAHTVTWAGGGTLRWSNGVAPVATSVSGKYDKYIFDSDAASGYTFGSDGGRNF